MASVFGRAMIDMQERQQNIIEWGSTGICYQLWGSNQQIWPFRPVCMVKIRKFHGPGPHPAYLCRRPWWTPARVGQEPWLCNSWVTARVTFHKNNDQQWNHGRRQNIFQGGAWTIFYFPGGCKNIFHAKTVKFAWLIIGLLGIFPKTCPQYWN